MAYDRNNRNDEKKALNTWQSKKSNNIGIGTPLFANQKIRGYFTGITFQLKELYAAIDELKLKDDDFVRFSIGQPQDRNSRIDFNLNLSTADDPAEFKGKSSYKSGYHNDRDSGRGRDNEDNDEENIGRPRRDQDDEGDDRRGGRDSGRSSSRRGGDDSESQPRRGSRY